MGDAIALENSTAALATFSLSHKVDYQVSLAGWLGFQTEGKGGSPINDLKSINPEMVQCIYGQDDSHDNACPALRGTGITVISMPRGHHLGGDYERLPQHIIASMKARMNK
ncbi:virulence factor [Rhizobium sp. VS19-DR104.2]|uniref:virulence factor n=1 Tax=unclassified Rhizobium TaxID=2613769 RepID=UPI001C5A7999|nr:MULTISPECIES: virulence factor [unclassified Rhizobium]MBZ5763691.1 virulence factor [Rhizobium sp. VS19-DR96]MBZ5769628.1 virulence factor [Rhizobium sp. VS19-DR129.2]MBZ5776527.1 virulence factor [Rhizobium sp. VS19-DRK62.2]MBZ5788305.1 virulence factor [Rhizobium sp. VS19-DR121]MBZ5804984.1 virulence factor [Rhizobium sp. VS19-DR181]